jgi:phosphoribosylaminoimidazole-succinocarboxamide synthase
VIDTTVLDTTLFESSLDLPRVARGKVRDIYAVGSDHLLLVTTDRLSAFDVVLPDPIPGKGAILTAMSNFWFAHFATRVPNHLSTLRLEDVLPDPAERAQVAGRAVVVRRLQPLRVEAVVRGYLIGSGWKEYRETGAVCGLVLPAELEQASPLPEPIFTPATKAEAGRHDENIDYATAARIVGAAAAAEVRAQALLLYREAALHARARGIIIADTKFEFGLDAEGRVLLMDEALTPDSSRFWPADQYRPGASPPSFDKQFVRDYLETLDWDKRPPGPRLPSAIIAQTAARYREALRRLTAA